MHAYAAHGVYLLDGVNLIVPELYAQCIVGIGQVYIHRITLDTEVATSGVKVVAHVEAIDQAAQQHVAVELHAHVYLNHAVVELGGVAHTIDARDGRHHNHILAPREQGRGGPQAQLVNLVVDGKVLLYIRIGRGYVCLGLVVIVVRHVVLYGIVGEEALHLAVELGGQRLVVTEDEGRAAHVLDDIGYGECLA